MLKGLTLLDISNNGLKGTIPEDLFIGLSNLQHLDLSGCNLSGTLSSNIGLLTQLRYLHLADNIFHGTIPPSLGWLELAQLSLNGNPNPRKKDR